jgi:glyoxylase-like metal-dependent hydrolase (beta-lactamase superfamily II)
MPAQFHITALDDSLYRIALPVPVNGFEGFISSWVYTGGPTVVIDVGPSSSAVHLVEALDHIGVSRPDMILLTHIHIDHAGGIGEVAGAFPDTPVICHPRAIEHVIDPRRLWDGSQKTLGDLARKYGPISPVPARQVRAADDTDLMGITAIPTPGHAPHQYSYLIGDLLFAGESGGVCIGFERDQYYMRPATPPILRLETTLESIDRLIECNPGRICYGHIGMQPDAVDKLKTHRAQLLRWRDMILPFFEQDPQNARGTSEACLVHLFANDGLLAGFNRFSAAARERERYFLNNSVRGYWGYLGDIRQS